MSLAGLRVQEQSTPAKADTVQYIEGFPAGASGKEHACQCKRHKRHGFNPWLGKSPREGHGNPPRYSCLENAMDRGAWQSTVHKFTKSGHDWRDLACMYSISSKVVVCVCDREREHVILYGTSRRHPPPSSEHEGLSWKGMGSGLIVHMGVERVNQSLLQGRSHAWQ